MRICSRLMMSSNVAGWLKGLLLSQVAAQHGYRGQLQSRTVVLHAGQAVPLSAYVGPLWQRKQIVGLYGIDDINSDSNWLPALLRGGRRSRTAGGDGARSVEALRAVKDVIQLRLRRHGRHVVVNLQWCWSAKISKGSVSENASREPWDKHHLTKR